MSDFRDSFGTIEYWNEEYTEGLFVEPFDWLASWEDLKTCVRSLLPCETSRVLIPGCGNAPFQIDMHRSGYTRMVCGDYSAVLIDNMRSLQETQGGSIQWDVMDVTRMPYADNNFQAVLDKSLVDCLLCCDGAMDVVRQYMDEAFRVLAPGGIFIIVSIQPKQKLKNILRGKDWDIVKLEAVGRTKKQVHDSSSSLACTTDQLVDASVEHMDSRTTVTICACMKRSADQKCNANTAKLSKILSDRRRRNERRKAQKRAS